MLEMIEVTNTNDSLATDFPPETTDPQTEIGEAITNLWSAHVNAKNTARATNEELRALRAKLGERLSEMKQILAKPGCDGQWSGFLREHNIPRASADRLVGRAFLLYAITLDFPLGRAVSCTLGVNGIVFRRLEQPDRDTWTWAGNP